MSRRRRVGASGGPCLTAVVGVSWAILVTGTLAWAQESGRLAGAVVDTAGHPVAGAVVTLETSARVVLATTHTDADGRFLWPMIPPGRHILSASSAPFAPVETVVGPGVSAHDVRLVLGTLAFTDEVTVTATRGVPEPVTTTTQSVNVLRAEDLALRARAVLAQAASEEAGLALQRTSPTIGAIYVRGFTGNKVNAFVDGVRFSTGSARGGINTFLNLIDPSFLQSVEVLRGPSSTEYGSDAIGGSLQFLTRTPGFSPQGPRISGQVSVHGDSADLGGGTAMAGEASFARVSLSVTGAARRSNDLRPGGGIDSHNAVTRFFGLPSSAVMGSRLPGTGFSQAGGAAKLAWAPTDADRLVAFYLRGQQEGGRRYDQLIGGDGNLVAELRSLAADLGYLSYEKTLPGFFQRVTSTYSFNAQREERVNQGGSGNTQATLVHEPERTTAHGLQVQASHVGARSAVAVGVDWYVERVEAPAFGVDPVSGVVSLRRGRVPNARYLQGGAYLHDRFQLVRDRLVVEGAVRWSRASYEARSAESPLVGGRPLWLDDRSTSSSVTARGGLGWTIREGVRAFTNVSQGFRAPHVTDLGTLGLTGSGFEIAAPAVEGLGATVGSTADGSAVSTGRAVSQVVPEKSVTYEVGAHVQRGMFTASLTGFIIDVGGNIAKQALILPPGAVGLALGDQVVSHQNANGAVFVASASNPVLVRSNVDRARVRGLEHTLSITSRAWALSLVGTALHAADRDTGLPPNIEGGTPPAEIYVAWRYAPRGAAREWVEPYLHVAATQRRISTLDLDDRRTGAGRSRTSIANFFNHGARARGLIANGTDGLPNTADDLLIATGEVLTEVQERVLGPTLASSALFPSIPGYATLGLRAGLRLGRHDVIVDGSNLTDRNYRGPSWGVDAPGRGVFVRVLTRF